MSDASLITVLAAIAVKVAVDFTVVFLWLRRKMTSRRAGLATAVGLAMLFFVALVVAAPDAWLYALVFAGLAFLQSLAAFAFFFYILAGEDAPRWRADIRDTFWPRPKRD